MTVKATQHQKKLSNASRQCACGFSPCLLLWPYRLCGPMQGISGCSRAQFVFCVCELFTAFPLLLQMAPPCAIELFFSSLEVFFPSPAAKAEEKIPASWWAGMSRVIINVINLIKRVNIFIHILCSLPLVGRPPRRPRGGLLPWLLWSPPGAHPLRG